MHYFTCLQRDDRLIGFACIIVAVLTSMSAVNGLGVFQLQVLSINMTELNSCWKNNISDVTLSYMQSEPRKSTNGSETTASNTKVNNEGLSPETVIVPLSNQGPNTTIDAFSASDNSRSGPNTTKQSSPLSKTPDNSGRLTIHVCLSHHQLPPPKDLKCTLGESTTHHRLTTTLQNFTHASVSHLPVMNISFSYSWPGSFSLKVTASMVCGKNRSKASYTVAGVIVPSETWTDFSDMSSVAPSLQNHGKHGIKVSSRQRRYISLPDEARCSPNIFRTRYSSNMIAKRRLPNILTKMLLIANPQMSVHAANNNLKHTYLRRHNNTQIDAMLRSNSGTSELQLPIFNTRKHFQLMSRKNLNTKKRDSYAKKRRGHTHSNLMRNNILKHRGQLRKALSKRSKQKRSTSPDLERSDLQRVLPEKSYGGQMGFAVRVVCAENYYGLNCSRFCRPRHDLLGHYNCSADGHRICRAGWRGKDCSEAICSPKCSSARSTCPVPGLCLCRHGWTGQHCQLCKIRHGCGHGYCHLPGQCICHPGWAGPVCDVEELFCLTHNPCRNGGTCVQDKQHTYTCLCPSGYIGADCEVALCQDKQFCLHAGLCYINEGSKFCQCSAPYTGLHCEHSISDTPHINMSMTFEPSVRSTTSSLLSEKRVSSLPAKSPVSPLPAMTTAYSLPAKSTATSLPAKSTASSLPAKSTASSLPAKSTATSLPAKSTASSLPAKSTASSLPAKSTTTSLPAKSTAFSLPAKSPASSLQSKLTVFMLPSSLPLLSTLPTSARCIGRDCPLRHHTVSCSGFACHFTDESYFCLGLGCRNNGICTLFGELLTAQCACPEPYSGPKCVESSLHSSELSPCASLPCLNGGSCFNIDIEEAGYATKDFFCRCSPNFSGRRCEIGGGKILPVIHSDEEEECGDYLICFNGGHCEESMRYGQHVCRCRDGFGGEYCEVDLTDPCYADPCLNDGTCSVDESRTSIACKCPPEYTGLRCETQLRAQSSTSEALSSSTVYATNGGSEVDLTDPCNADPCLNAGTCSVDMSRTFIACMCHPDYTGPRCETELRAQSSTFETLSSSTEYATNGVSGYTTAKYRMTESDVNEDILCSRDKCQNGGTCFEHDGEFFCVCKDNYRGVFCQRKAKKRHRTKIQVKIKTVLLTPRSPASSAAISFYEIISLSSVIICLMWLLVLSGS